MENDIYRQMAQVESKHWWFLGRRTICETIIAKLERPNKHILDIGCGTGGNLPMLSRHGIVLATEPNTYAREHANSFGCASVVDSMAPVNIEKIEPGFGLITTFDVLEHLEEDEATLAAIYNRLAPNGVFLATVPAHSNIWSLHDERRHHVRRYSIPEIKRKIIAANLQIEYISYINCFLFPAAWLQRKFMMLLGNKYESGDDKIPFFLLNFAFKQIFSLEKFAFPATHLPFGLTIVVVCRRPN